MGEDGGDLRKWTIPDGLILDPDEHLALVLPDGQTVVHEYAPAYPAPPRPLETEDIVVTATAVEPLAPVDSLELTYRIQYDPELPPVPYPDCGEDSTGDDLSCGRNPTCAAPGR